MEKEIQEFFERIIGYNGETWCVCHSKKYGEHHAWFLHDIERMIDNRVGYPALLYLIAMISYLGACINPKNKEEKEIKNIGNSKDFYYFIDNYLYLQNEKYKKYKEILYYQVRSKLAHVYFTLNAVTTSYSNDHLSIKKIEGSLFLFLSVKNFMEDTMKATERLYNIICENEDSDKNFYKNKKNIFKLLIESMERSFLKINCKDNKTETYSTLASNFPEDVSGTSTKI